MPIVFAAHRPFISEDTLHKVFLGARRIVAAALECDEGHLSPSDIEFIPTRVANSDYLTEDVVLTISAWPFDARQREAATGATGERIVYALHDLEITTESGHRLTYGTGGMLALHWWFSSAEAGLGDSLLMPQPRVAEANANLISAMHKAQDDILAFDRRRNFRVEQPLG